eukprot:1152881-Pelagomonas_calceolata.AAC.2
MRIVLLVGHVEAAGALEDALANVGAGGALRRVMLSGDALAHVEAGGALRLTANKGNIQHGFACKPKLAHTLTRCIKRKLGLRTAIT